MKIIFANGDTVSLGEHTEGGTNPTGVFKIRHDDKNISAINVVADITVPAGLTLLSATASAGTVDIGLEQWTIPELEAGKEETLDLFFTITDNSTVPWDIVLTSVFYAAGDDLGDNTATRTINVDTCSTLEVCGIVDGRYENTIFVTPTGNNLNAAREYRAQAYTTPWDARDAANVGDTIRIYPGSYSVGRLGSGADYETNDEESHTLFGNDITYICEGDVLISNVETTSSISLFKDTNGYTTKFYGPFSFLQEATDGYLFTFTHDNTVLEIYGAKDIMSHYRGWDKTDVKFSRFILECENVSTEREFYSNNTTTTRVAESYHRLKVSELAWFGSGILSGIAKNNWQDFTWRRAKIDIDVNHFRPGAGFDIKNNTYANGSVKVNKWSPALKYQNDDTNYPAVSSTFDIYGIDEDSSWTIDINEVEFVGREVVKFHPENIGGRVHFKVGRAVKNHASTFSAGLVETPAVGLIGISGEQGGAQGTASIRGGIIIEGLFEARDRITGETTATDIQTFEFTNSAETRTKFVFMLKDFVSLQDDTYTFDELSSGAYSFRMVNAFSNVLASAFIDWIGQNLVTDTDLIFP